MSVISMIFGHPVEDFQKAAEIIIAEAIKQAKDATREDGETLLMHVAERVIEVINHLDGTSVEMTKPLSISFTITIPAQEFRLKIPQAEQ